MFDTDDIYFNDSDFDESYDQWLDDFEDDLEADADALASIGWGDDEDYGYYGPEDAAFEMALFGDC